MAVEPCVRVCLHFSDLNEQTCWFLVDYKKMPTIECVQQFIGRKFYESDTTSFKLTLKGSLLPAWESSLILRDDDQVIVEPEAPNRHNSHWSKKRKHTANSQKSPCPPSAKDNSLSCTSTKDTGTSGGNEESLSETLQNSVSTPHTEVEEQKSKKKKKKKSDGPIELNVDIEEIPAPNKKQKITKAPKNDPNRKKKSVTKDSRPELIEVVGDDVNGVYSPRSENQKGGKVNLCDKSDSPYDLNRIKSEMIKVLDEVSVISDHAIPKETSNTFSNGKKGSKVKQNANEGNTSFAQLTDNLGKCLRKGLAPSATSSISDLEKSYKVPQKTYSHITPKKEDITIKKENITPQKEDITIKKENITPQKENTSITQLTDSIDRDWGKKSYNVPKESSSHPVQEKYEVFKIASEDLETMCQSLNEGETFTIDQDKVEVIDVKNSSNSSWLDCVEVDSSFPDESKRPDKAAGQDSGKGSGSNTRKRRRRRGQRSFACSPFIHEMSQSPSSAVDNRSPVSTPVATAQPKKWPSSSGDGSQRHFHFESDDEEEEEEDDVEEENISQHKITAAGDSKTENFESSKSTLSSDKTVMNGAEDSNSSFVSQGEENNSMLSSQKYTPKKSVHFALENNSCQSFDDRQGPVIYKRGQNANQRRAYPTLLRQQQLNSLEDGDNTSVNSPTPKPSKPSKEYNLLPPIVGYPRAGDKIAFKRLEIGDDYTPRLSDFTEARVISFQLQEDKKMLTMKVTSSQNNRKKDGKFELFYEDEDNDIMILDQQDDIAETVELGSLHEVKLLK